MVIQAIYHAVISIIIFLNTPANVLHPSMWFVTLDQTVLFTAMGIFVLIHAILVIWLFVIPFGNQKKMDERDTQYMLRISEKIKGKVNPAFEQNIGNLSAMPIYQ